jgi:hypothetical protein
VTGKISGIDITVSEAFADILDVATVRTALRSELEKAQDERAARTAAVDALKVAQNAGRAAIAAR